MVKNGEVKGNGFIAKRCFTNEWQKNPSQRAFAAGDFEMPLVVKCVSCGRVLYEGNPPSLVRGAHKECWYTFLDQLKISMDFHCPHCGSALGPVSKIVIKAAGARQRGKEVQ